MNDLIPGVRITGDIELFGETFMLLIRRLICFASA